MLGILIYFPNWMLTMCLLISPVSHGSAFRIFKHFDAVDADHITSGKNFEVQRLDRTKEAEWQVLPPCTIENASAAVTSVNCVGAGFYPISSIAEDFNVTRFVQVRKSPLCYNWYIATLNQSSNAHTDHNVWHFRVWIIDPQHASTEEFEKQAQLPSKGCDPDYAHKRTSTKLDAEEKKERAWVIEVNIQFQYEILLIVKGKPEVAVDGCIVRDTSLVLSLPKFINIMNSPFTNMDAEKLHGDPEGQPQLIQDPCTSSVAVIILSDAVFLTQDNFKSSLNLYLPKPIILDNSLISLVVLRAAFTPTELLLLIDGTIIAMDKDTGIFKAVTGLPPATSMKSLKGRYHCMPTTMEQLNIIHAVTWSADSQAFYLHHGKSSTSSAIFKQVMIWMELLQPLGFDKDANVNIHDIAFDCPSGKIGVLASITQDSLHAIVILVYNTVTAEWTNLPYWIDDVQNESYSMMFLNTAESGLLFWSSSQLYYSYQNGLNVGTMEVLSSNTSSLSSYEEDIIHQVLVSDGGDIVLHMYPSNHIYYTRINQQHLILLPADELPGVQHLLFFGSLGSLNSITNISTVSSYPLALHVAGSVYPQVCKYRNFEHNSIADVYYLDLGRQVSLSASLTYSLHYYNTIKVLSSSDKLLRQHIVDNIDYYQGWQTLNRTFIIESAASLYGIEDYQEQKEGAMTDTILEMKPEMTDLSCKRPDAMTVHVSLGCPPGRHIQVHKPTECQMPAAYTIPRSSLHNARNVSTSSKEADYSQEIGCPIINHYKDSFLPDISLYDGDVLIEEMAANYILWEVQGRSDYSYTANMQQVGCQSTAQTWEKMLQDHGGGEQSLERTWGPHNYRHCFFENKTAAVSGEDLLQPYEILNSTGVNWIVWDTWRDDSIYQFTVLVIDPQYSFCRLQTSFGVHLIGLIPSTTPTAAIMNLSIGLFAILTLSLGFVSYIFFRNKHIDEYKLFVAHVNEEDEEPSTSNGVGDAPSADSLKM